MQRRKFIQKVAVISGGISMLTNYSYAEGVLGINRAKRLVKGDKVGVITPGSALSQEGFEEALDNIRSLGLEPVKATYANQKYGFLGGTDYQRLSDLHEVFSDNQIKGVICARGGYGTARIIQNIDYNLIRKNPKVLIGFSDITALLNAVYQQTSLICFHGPVGASQLTDFTRMQLQSTIMEGNPLSLKAESGYTIKGGYARGKLVGGNLSLIAALVGTANEINFNRKIVFIEEVGEAPYRIDRMLTQLIAGGKLRFAKGIVFGKFADCDEDPTDSDYMTKFNLKQVLTERCARLNMPVYYGFDFGHVADNATLPLGLKVDFNADEGTLIARENAVT